MEFSVVEHLTTLVTKAQRRHSVFWKSQALKIFLAVYRHYETIYGTLLRY